MAGLIDRVLQRSDLTPYERGYVHGVYAYAVMKDGTYYVGSTGLTLTEALKRFFVETERTEVIDND